MPDSDQSAFASDSLAGHIRRGAVGFGLLGSALALTSSIGGAAFLLVPAGLLALRGCPMCWTVGLIETISAGRLRRTCTDGDCARSSSLRLRHPHPVPTNGGQK
jgi:hypothetical protein